MSSLRNPDAPNPRRELVSRTQTTLKSSVEVEHLTFWRVCFVKACDCAAVEGIKTTTAAAAAAAAFRLQLIQRLRQHLPRRRSSCPDVCGDPEVRGRVPRVDADRPPGGIRRTRSAAGAAAPAPPRSIGHADTDARVSSLSSRLTS